MPSSYSFDVVSEFDQQELVNAIDQLRREVDQRYDLKDSKTKIDIKEDELSIVSLSDMTIESVKDILLKKGLSQEIAKKLSKLIRDNIKKVTVSIQGESLRITGKNKDDLQSAINLIKKQEDDLEIALQFQNYR